MNGIAPWIRCFPSTALADVILLPMLVLPLAGCAGPEARVAAAPENATQAAQCEVPVSQRASAPRSAARAWNSTLTAGIVTLVTSHVVGTGLMLTAAFTDTAPKTCFSLPGNVSCYQPFTRSTAELFGVGLGVTLVGSVVGPLLLHVGSQSVALAPGTPVTAPMPGHEGPARESAFDPRGGSVVVSF